jgi:hypothetical protein
LILAQNQHLETLADNAGAIAGSIDQGRMGSQAFGNLQNMQRQYDQYSYSALATAAASSGTLDQVDGVSMRSQSGNRVSDDIYAGTIDQATATRYASKLPTAYPIVVVQNTQDEAAARAQVQQYVQTGDFDSARALASQRLNQFSGTGNQPGAEAWLTVMQGLGQPGSPPPADPTGHAGPGWTDLSSITGAFNRPGAAPDQLASRDAQYLAIAQAEQGARIGISNAVNQGDYGTAAAMIADQARHYREVGDERTALKYEIALTEVTGLRQGVRGGYFDPNSFDRMSADEQRAAEATARRQVVSDIGVTPQNQPEGERLLTSVMPDAGRVAGSTYDRIYGFNGIEQTATRRIEDAVDRGNDGIYLSGNKPKPEIIDRTRRRPTDSDAE